MWSVLCVGVGVVGVDIEDEQRHGKWTILSSAYIHIDLDIKNQI